MKKILTGIMVFLLLGVLTVPVFGAGSSNDCSSYAADEGVSRIWILTCTWTADDATGAVPSATSPKITGYIMKAETNPGSTAPTDNYDITLSNSNGVDMFGSNLLNRDTATSEQTVPNVVSTATVPGVGGMPYVDDTLTMALSNNSVNSATGTLQVWIWREQ